MAIPRPEPGLVIRYNFLWRREAETGREHASKARPCAIVTSVRRLETGIIVTVTPITHSPPGEREFGIEIPPAVKPSLGLDDDRSWIITNELNTFLWPGPDLEPVDPHSPALSYGHLPKPLTIAVLRAALAHVRSGRAKSIKRTQ